MRNHLYMCLTHSKANTSVKPKGSSTWYPHTGQHFSIRTFRQLRAHQTSSLTWRKTETSLIVECFRSMADQLEEVSSLPTTHMPQLSTQAVSQRLSVS
nr:C4 [Tomato yellow leaf curl virus]